MTQFFKWLALLGAMLLLSAVGYLGWHQLVTVNDVHHSDVKGAIALAQAQDALWQLRYEFPNFLVYGPEDRARIVAEEPKLYEQVSDAINRYRATASTTAEQTELQHWDEIYGKYVRARPHWFELIAANKLEEAATYRAATTTPFGAEAVKTLEQLISLQEDVANTRYSRALYSAIISWAVLVGVTTISVLATWWLFVLKAGRRQLVAAREAALAASRAKGEFLANMSHEIRTPMNAIIGMTDMVLDTNLTDEQRENLQIVKTSCESLLQIINDILDFSKIEAGKLELESSEFSLRKVTNDTVKSLSVRAHEKNLELACRVAPGAPDEFIGDPLRLRQVLVNLIGNAIKFTQQGEIVVSAESEHVDEEHVRVHFSVRDSGIGISKTEQRRIFDAFTQADGSSTRRFGGTGLGLAISARLVAVMGGHIWVDSEPGKGSTFHFTTVFRRDIAGEKRQASGRVDLTGLRVLIVDDNATNRLILEEVICSWQMRATCVDSGPAALEKMRSAVDMTKPFELVLLDAMMPGMSGFEVAERCKADSKIAGATIMMLSSADVDSDAARCRELGICRYLRKPVAMDELQEAVTTALGGVPTKKPMPTASAFANAEPVARWNILLAEDNVVNQRVAVSILQKKGHQVQPVNNGKEALEALACERFDLVLMDLQMPEMDGLEATSAIRAQEKQTRQHVPIIAMTAHAMKGDRERCLEAGMDDYLSKPVEPRALYALVDSWGAWARGNSSPVYPDHTNRKVDMVESSNTNDRPAVRNPTGVRSDVFDIAALRARVENDLDLLAEMIELYLTSSPALLVEIEAAVAARDGDKIARGAHTLKGVLKNMCAATCAEAAFQLETVSKTNDLALADESLATLKNEFQRLKSVLNGVAKGAVA